MAEELTLAALREIRDEIRMTRTDLSARLDATNERLDATNERLDATNVRLEHVETALLDLAEQQRFVVRWLAAGTERDRALEQRVDLLETRVGRLESGGERGDR